jgi:hypothetical protein
MARKPNNPKIIEYLKSKVTAHEYSILFLLLGMKKQTYYYIIQNPQKAKVDFIKSIAKACKVPTGEMAEVFTGEYFEKNQEQQSTTEIAA